jgi:uncharacterized protein YwgA
MTTQREDIVVAVVSAAEGHTLAGRTRLQKIVYLLDQLGLNSGFGYDYHHYGPYSRDLDSATADAQAFGLLEEKFDHRKSDGAMYSIFTSKREPKSEAYGKLSVERTEQLVRQFAKTNVTILELAATVDWLWRFERRKDWDAEIRKRKSVKVQDGRLEKAVAILQSLGLAPPSASAAAA